MNFNRDEIKNILVNKAYCLGIGFTAHDTIIRTFDEIREQYINKVGLRTYLREMLGELGHTPIRYCTLYHEDGHRLILQLNGNYRQSVHRFIANQFQCQGRLPFKIEIHNQGQVNQVAICYL